MKFELNEKEIATLERHKESIKDIYESVGAISFTFSNSSGIGQSVHVTFDDYKITKDITDYASW